MSASQGPPGSRRLLRLLTRLYPRGFRERFGPEMLEVFERDLGSRHSAGQRAAFWWRSVWGALTWAPKEHLVDLGADLRQVARSARRRPLFFGISSLSMGLGLGAIVTILATIQSVFLTPIAGIEEPDRLINVKPYSSHQDGFVSASYPDYTDFAAGAGEVEGLTGFIGLPLVVKIGADDEPQAQLAQATASNYMQVVGAPVWRGRYFTEAEEQGLALKVFVSHWFWQNRLGSPETLPNLFVNGVSYELIGVGAPGFRGLFKGFPSDVFVPLGARSELGLPELHDRSARWLELVGRLQGDSSVEDAAADFGRLGEIAASEHAMVNRDLSVQVERTTGLDADFRGGLAVFLSALLVVGCFVLTVSVLNVAGMMAARAAELQQSFDIRFALGAPAHRLARLVLAETTVLGLLAAVVGVGMAVAAVRRVTGIFAAVDERIHLVVDLDPSIFVAVLALVTLVAFIAAASSGLSGLGRGGSLQQRGELEPRQGWRRVLVVGQVILSFVVLAAAALFASVLRQTADIPLGFDPTRVAASSIDPRLAAREPNEVLEQTLRSVEALSEVERAALTNRVPLSLGARFFPNRATVAVAGLQPPDGAEGFAVEHSIVSAGYFHTMSIELLSGRGFDSREAESERMTAVVNQAFVERFFEDGAGVGREIVVDGTPTAIVGVSANSKARTLDEELAPLLYLSFEQRRPQRAVLLARTKGPSELVLPEIRNTQRTVAPDLPVQELDTLENRLASALLPQRVGAAAAGSLGLLGLLLSATGLYGVLAQWVSSRVREMGLRTSLGAKPTDVLMMVLRQGAVLSLLGISIGVPAAIGIAVLLRGFLYGLSPLQLPVYLLVATVMLIAAALASALPARRALSISPMEALRA